MPESFDTGSLTWVKDEIDAALGNVLGNIEQFASDPQDVSPLKFARTHLFQVKGALNMVGLAGCERLCVEIETVCTKLEKQEIQASSDCFSIIRQAVQALSAYLTELMETEQDVPLKLYSEFAQLLMLQGQAADESELFFPDTSIRVPKDLAATEVVASDATAYYAKQRNAFLKALLGWLRASPELKPEALELLVAVLEGMQTSALTPAQRTLWWTAAGFVESLRDQNRADVYEVKLLLRKIDQQIKSMLAGSQKVSDHLMRNLLYYVAKTPTETSARIGQIQTLFELQEMIPLANAAEAKIVISQQDLLLLEHLLDTMKSLLSAFVLDTENALADFQSKLHLVMNAAHQMPDLLGLLNAIMQYLEAPVITGKLFGNDESGRLEIATGLTLAEDYVRNMPRPSSDLLEKIHAQIQRYFAADQFTSLESASDNTVLGELDIDVVLAVARQIQGNLRFVEEKLDVYFRDTAQQAFVQQIRKPMAEVRAAFDILSLTAPHGLALRCEQLLLQCSDSPDPQLLELLAEGISTVGLYANHMPRTQREHDLKLMECDKRLMAYLDQHEATELLSQDAQLPAADVIQSTSVPADMLSDDLEDGDLLGIYLAEAEEVLDLMHEQLQQLRQEPANHALLVDLRRGFHTLKGSGRAVGQDALGEVAWGVEQILNRLTEHKLPLTGEAMQYVDEVSQTFESWVESLKAGNQIAVDVPQYQERVQNLLAGVLETKQKNTGDEVVIGGSHKISRALFNIFIAEAWQHIQTLKDTAQLYQADSTTRPVQETIRAAHTLASNAGTAGFRAIISLARLFENWLDLHPGLWTQDTSDLYERVVSGLEAMLVKAEQMRQPKQAIALKNLLTISLADFQRAQAEPLSDLPLDADGMPSALDGTFATDAHLVLDSAIPSAEDDVLLQPLELVDPVDASGAQVLPDEVMEPLEQIADIAFDAEPVNIQGDGFQEVTYNPYTFESDKTVVGSEPSTDAVLDTLQDSVQDEVPVFALDPLDTPDPIELGNDLGDALIQAADISGELPADTLTEIPADLQALAPVSQVQAQVKPALVQAVIADNELLATFVDEAREILPQIGASLRSWQSAPDDLDQADELQRLLHTLKGSARMTGQKTLADHVHEFEDSIVRGLRRKDQKANFDELFEHYDQADALLDEIARQAFPTGESAQNSDQDDALPLLATPERKDQFMRLRGDALERLINEAGEISIARSRIERELQRFKGSSKDLSDSVVRLRQQLREMEIEAESQLQSRMAYLQETNESFDPLEFDRFTRLQELTRLMAESVNDVTTIQTSLLRNLDETESALLQQSRMSRELQRNLMNVRMVPFSMIVERLQRIVRQTAKELGKPVSLTVEGGLVNLDRGMLDKLVVPLEHLLRNAIAHGIESPAVRKKAKKASEGSIALRVYRENDEIIVTVADDGAGVDLEKVRARAIAIGLFEADQAISSQTLMQVLFESGFSTAETVTQIAGRGVGLDSVRTDIGALGGRIDVSNASGQGAVFTMYLPVTLSVTQVVMVRVGHSQFALPAVMVRQVQTIKAAELAQAYERKAVEWSGSEYPLFYFGNLLRLSQMPEQQAYTPVMLLSSGNYQIALHVDEILHNQEIVTKPIGAQLIRVPGIMGATVLGDGQVILVMNPVQLANREDMAAGTVHIAAVDQPEVQEQVKTLILVVDDSLTMRKVLSRLLEREGYQVAVAKDGMDALQVLQDIRPDVILTDIEMPRMDGFEFARSVRGDRQYDQTPLVVISSRTAEKHQNLGKEIGVDLYLGKPVQDEELIRHIKVLLENYQKNH